MCKTFTPVNYERLLTAYRYLGKTQIAMDQLIIHFMTAINHESFSVLLDHNGVCKLLRIIISFLGLRHFVKLADFSVEVLVKFFPIFFSTVYVVSTHVTVFF